MLGPAPNEVSGFGTYFNDAGFFVDAKLMVIDLFYKN
jgi:hypothetical protein